MNFIKIFSLIFLFALFFSSCEQCKDCTITYETINGYDAAGLDATAQLLGYADWNAYVSSMYTPEEFCDEALDEAEDLEESADLDMDGTNDYRVFWNCQ
jgi:hypothetical protein